MLPLWNNCTNNLLTRHFHLPTEGTSYFSFVPSNILKRNDGEALQLGLKSRIYIPNFILITVDSPGIRDKSPNVSLRRRGMRVTCDMSISIILTTMITTTFIEYLL